MTHPPDRYAWISPLLDQQSRIDLVRCLELCAKSGWRMEPRRHGDHVLYLVLDGHIDATVAGHGQRWRAGELHWIAPGVAHAAERGSGCRNLRFRVLRIGCRDRRARVIQEDGTEQRHCSQARHLAAVFTAIAAAARAAPAARELRLRAAVVDGFVQVLDACLDDGQRGGLSSIEHERLQRWWDAHCEAAVEAADLARLLDRSPGRLRRAFAHSFGCTPREWLAGRRLAHAAGLLHDEDLAVEQVATRCGYASVASFTRLFRDRFGAPPRRWRRKRIHLMSSSDSPSPSSTTSMR